MLAGLLLQRGLPKRLFMFKVAYAILSAQLAAVIPQFVDLQVRTIYGWMLTGTGI